MLGAFKDNYVSIGLLAHDFTGGAHSGSITTDDDIGSVHKNSFQWEG
jgi:hypothetical protein